MGLFSLDLQIQQTSHILEGLTKTYIFSLSGKYDCWLAKGHQHLEYQLCHTGKFRSVFVASPKRHGLEPNARQLPALSIHTDTQGIDFRECDQTLGTEGKTEKKNQFFKKKDPKDQPQNQIIFIIVVNLNSIRSCQVTKKNIFSLKLRGWGIESVVKSLYRGLEFDSQQP